MSYEPDLQIKKLCALENSRSKTLVLVATLTNEAIWVKNGNDWVEEKPIPGTSRYREMQSREGLPVDEGES